MLKRLFEPSTWAGVGVILQTLKLVIPPVYHPVIDGLSGAAGAAAAVISEKTQKA